MLQAIYNFIVGLARMLVDNPEPEYGLLTDQTHFKLYCLELAPDSMNKDYLKLSYPKLNYRQANPDCCSLSQVDNYIKTKTTLIKLLAGIIQNQTKNLPQIFMLTRTTIIKSEGPHLAPLGLWVPLGQVMLQENTKEQCVGLENSTWTGKGILLETDNFWHLSQLVAGDHWSEIETTQPIDGEKNEMTQAVQVITHENKRNRVAVT